MGDLEGDDQRHVEPDHTAEELLEVVRVHEPVTTQEVAEVLDVAHQSADYRLWRLQEKGKLQTKTTESTRVWMIVEGY